MARDVPQTRVTRRTPQDRLVEGETWRLATIEELRQALLELQRLYNQSWIVQRHGDCTPAQVCAEHLGTLAAAA